MIQALKPKTCLGYLCAPEFSYVEAGRSDEFEPNLDHSSREFNDHTAHLTADVSSATSS